MKVNRVGNQQNFGIAYAEITNSGKKGFVHACEALATELRQMNGVEVLRSELAHDFDHMQVPPNYYITLECPKTGVREAGDLAPDYGKETSMLRMIKKWAKSHGLGKVKTSRY